MNKFAFMIHPLTTDDLARKFPLAKNLPPRIIEGALQLAPPFKASNITGLMTPYSEAEGYFVTCPLTSHQMVTLPLQQVMKKIIQTGKLAEKLGAQIIGLGAFTSVVGDAGITVAKHLNIPVTTGNTYTVVTAIEGTQRAAQLMGIDMTKAEVVVVGATGSIGSTCAQVLAEQVKYLTLIARDERKLDRLADYLLKTTGTAARVTSNLNGALQRADIVVTASGSAEAIIDPLLLKPGAVVCDVARPRDVLKQVADLRNDVLVIEGGVVEVPGDVDFGINFGFPPKTSYACMAETMMLTLEGRFESFTLGREISVDKVREMQEMAHKHGFRLAALRSFERALDVEEIEQVRLAADQKKRTKISS